VKENQKGGFTLVELLVVISIMSVLMGMLLPVLGKARHQARTVLGINNQHQVVGVVNCFALDNDESYPPSVATIGHDNTWNWQEPFVITNYESRAPHLHRAMSEYLRGYIKDASSMFCPNAPRKYRYAQEAWDAGDEWDNPDTLVSPDWVVGTYCFYWNYTGLMERGLFRGPRNPAGGRGQSKLLASCYFGYDNWRNEKVYGTHHAYGSCERFKRAGITPGQPVYPAGAAFWSRLKADGVNLKTIDTMLHAAYTDGHVESFSASEVVTMRVIKDQSTSTPYDYGPGDFYLPRNSLR
jgi:prepilin-type N-terminal cleavage/methylation domain-containing protein